MFETSDFRLHYLLIRRSRSVTSSTSSSIFCTSAISPLPFPWRSPSSCSRDRQHSSAPAGVEPSQRHWVDFRISAYRRLYWKNDIHFRTNSHVTAMPMLQNGSVGFTRGLMRNSSIRKSSEICFVMINYWSWVSAAVPSHSSLAPSIVFAACGRISSTAMTSCGVRPPRPISFSSETWAAKYRPRITLRSD